jgi:uncharacterized protein
MEPKSARRTSARPTGESTLGSMDRILDTALEQIRKAFPGVQAVWLFGSTASGDAHADSDIDLAVLLPPGRRADPTEIFRLRASLTEALGRETDLVSLREAPVAFANEIVSHGGRIWEASVRAADEFEMRTLSSWQKLNEERAGILEDVLATGRILSHG